MFFVIMRTTAHANQISSILKFGLLRKDFFANPCREMLAGGLRSPSGKHFKRKML
jgi:hypothetical protein